ncbi:MAG TPA: PQQ-dependent sugar dehydrogenase, partial [Candidatus Krumholzibacteria bacterium]|nr:PQQ-dependent sugar dehydrogenase [Candidatus Krumholzibacteria bacterium]
NQTLDPATEVRLLEVQATTNAHKGGQIAFGPDGLLYWSLGDDGANGNDPSNNGQDTSTAMGSVLRIDVDSGTPYAIPPGNPFAGGGGLPEIWAWGFRNPWRFSIDSVTGKIWLGDVGQDTWEEINIVRKGRNYGWPRTEGTMCYLPPACDTVGLDIDLPVYQYPHTGGASITGGFVYRGPTQTSLTGLYVYADYIEGVVWALSYNGVDPPVNQTLHEESWPGLIPSFGVDAAGELYFASFDGRIYRFFETATAVETPAPAAGSLGAVHPNPFRSDATIAYTIAASSRAALEVFDVRGGRVAVLFDGPVPAGSGTAVWDGRDEGGRPLPSGVYFCRLTVGGATVDARRILLLK